jgi:hypothetical protein
MTGQLQAHTRDILATVGLAPNGVDLMFSSESMGGAGSSGSREYIAQVPPIPIGVPEGIGLRARHVPDASG